MWTAIQRRKRSGFILTCRMGWSCSRLRTTASELRPRRSGRAKRWGCLVCVNVLQCLVVMSKLRGFPGRERRSSCVCHCAEQTMKILIVDDHTIFRDGLKRVLLDEFKTAIFGDAGNAAEALKQVWKEKWDLVLLDITMHGRSGLDFVKEIRTSVPNLPVLILSGHPEEQYAVRVLRAGADGYLTKESASQELCSAVRKLLSGGKYISARLGEQLAAEIRSPQRDLHETLSNRV